MLSASRSLLVSSVIILMSAFMVSFSCAFLAAVGIASDVEDADNDVDILSVFDDEEDDDVHDFDWLVICVHFKLSICLFLLPVLLLLLLADGRDDDKAIFSSRRFLSSDCDIFIVGRSRKL